MNVVPLLKAIAFLLLNVVQLITLLRSSAYTVNKAAKTWSHA